MSTLPHLKWQWSPKVYLKKRKNSASFQIKIHSKTTFKLYLLDGSLPQVIARVFLGLCLQKNSQRSNIGSRKALELKVDWKLSSNTN